MSLLITLFLKKIDLYIFVEPADDIIEIFMLSLCVYIYII